MSNILINDRCRSDIFFIMATNFKLTFKMLAKDSGTLVSFKQDGQRFEQPYTVKLNGGTDYEMKFTLRPVIHIDKLMINGDIHKLDLLKSTTDLSDSVSYVTYFTTTGYDVSKSGKRKEVLVVLELENGVYMKISLQCKVYRLGDTDHAHWGQKLNALEYECEISKGHNYVKILKEKYL